MGNRLGSAFAAQLRRLGLLLVALGFAGPSWAEQTATPDPAARLPSGGQASEYWDLLAEFPDGHRLFARFLITNAGPGDRNAVAVGTLHQPAGEPLRFRNARRESRWQLSDDRLRLDVGKSHLDLRGPERHYEITKGALQLGLRFGGGDSLSVPAAELPEGYSIDLVESAATARGWYQRGPQAKRVNLSDGRVTLVHTVAQNEEARQIRRRIELIGLDEETSFYLVDWVSPGGEHQTWSSLRGFDNGTSLEISSSEISTSLRGTAEGWGNRDYWVPRSMELLGSPLVGAVEIGPVLQEEDSLRDLPAPFRWALGLRMRPLRVWAGATFEVRLLGSPGSAPRIQQGNGLMTISFLDELPRESVQAR